MAALLQSFSPLFKNLVFSFRPKQWIKNGALFAPLLFSQNLFTSTLFWKTIEAFILFCLLTGSVYVINDLKDRNEDRLHPVKKNRPLASGKLSPPLAGWVACLTLIGSLVIGARPWLLCSFFIAKKCRYVRSSGDCFFEAMAPFLGLGLIFWTLAKGAYED